MFGTNRFTREKNVFSCFTMSAAWWKAPVSPLIFSSVNIDMSEALAWISAYRESTGEKITVTHLCTKALALALRKYPQTNAKVEGNAIYIRNTVDIALMVSLDSGDLSGIKVNEADMKSIDEIAREVREGAQAVRQNRGPSYQVSKDIMEHCSIFFAKIIMKVAGLMVNRFNMDLSFLGFPNDPFGSAVVTSVNRHGIESAYGPLIPVGRFGLALVVPEIRERPWADNGSVVVRPVLKLCFTFDHRVFHGYYVSLVEKEVKRLLEDPAALLGEKAALVDQAGLYETGNGTERLDIEPEQERLSA